MQEPRASLVGIEGDRDGSVGGNDDRIAHSAGKPSSTDGHDLKMMAVQMHRMHHCRRIDERHLDALALADVEGLMLTVDAVVDRPAIPGPFTQIEGEGFVRLFRRQRACREQLRLKFKSDHPLWRFG